MTVIVLGGAGHIGSGIVKELVRLSNDLDVIIADRNVERGEEIAKELGGRVLVKKVDANDFQSLVEIFRGADVVVSTLGPFYLWGEKVLKAALKARVDFLDINDDYDATDRCLGLHEEAIEAGVLAIVGLGTTPGLTNILAKFGAEDIDAKEIDIAWAWTAVDPSMGPAIIYHFFHAITGEVPSFYDGNWVNVRALSDPELVEFPNLGKMGVVNVGHPEPLTIPRYIKGLKKVTNKGTIWPRSLADLAKTFARIGLTGLKEINLCSQKISAREFLVELTLRLNEFFSSELLEEVMRELAALGDYAMGVGLRVEVNGIKNGKEIRRVYSLSSQSAVKITALPAALGVLELISKKVEGTGVYPPEGVINASRFLAEIANEFEILEREEREGRLELKAF